MKTDELLVGDIILVETGDELPAVLRVTQRARAQHKTYIVKNCLTSFHVRIAWCL